TQRLGGGPRGGLLGFLRQLLRLLQIRQVRCLDLVQPSLELACGPLCRLTGVTLSLECLFPVRAERLVGRVALLLPGLLGVLLALGGRACLLRHGSPNRWGETRTASRGRVVFVSRGSR